MLSLVVLERKSVVQVSHMVCYAHRQYGVSSVVQVGGSRVELPRASQKHVGTSRIKDPRDPEAFTKCLGLCRGFFPISLISIHSFIFIYLVALISLSYHRWSCLQVAECQSGQHPTHVGSWSIEACFGIVLSPS